jgi:hypothetical protein
MRERARTGQNAFPPAVKREVCVVLEHKSFADHQQAENWRSIRLFFDHGLSLNADTLTVLSYTDPATGGRFASPVRRSLRGELEMAARFYLARTEFLAEWRTTRSRKTLKANRDWAAKACARLAEINTSQVLWAGLNGDRATGIQLDKGLEQTVIPHLARLAAFFAKQVDALGPYDPAGNRNAAQLEEDEYFSALCEIWEQLKADDNERRRRRFMILAATAVFGDKAASKIGYWFRRKV